MQQELIKSLSDRLSSIETKLDVLIRLEERQASMAAAHSQLLRRVEATEKEMTAMKVAQSGANAKNGALDYLVKSMFALAAGVVGALAVKFFGG